MGRETLPDLWINSILYRHAYLLFDHLMECILLLLFMGVKVCTFLHECVDVNWQWVMGSSTQSEKQTVI